MECTSMDVIVCPSSTPELAGNLWLEELNRVLKPGGKILIQVSLPSAENIDKPSLALDRKLTMAGYLDIQVVETKAFLQRDGGRVFTAEGVKASWTVGSSFTIKKPIKTIPKTQIDDSSDLIDEDSLLMEEDLKKPQLPPA